MKTILAVIALLLPASGFSQSHQSNGETAVEPVKTVDLGSLGMQNPGAPANVDSAIKMEAVNVEASQAAQANLQAEKNAPPEESHKKSKEKTLKSLAAAAPRMTNDKTAPQAQGKFYDGSAKAGAAEVNTAKAGAAHASGLTPSDAGFERLYNTLQPDNYGVHLKLDPSKDTFEGNVTLTGKLGEKKDRIKLHGVDMTVHSARLTVNGREVKISNISMQKDEAQQTITLELDHKVDAGAVKIEIAYTGKFQNDLQGLYRATDKHDGKDDYSIYSQFEATEFRKAIPGIDEPEAKATFDVTITAPAGKKVLFNTKETGRTVDGGWQTVKFARTPRMSSYPTAFAVGRFESISTELSGGRRLSVWAQPEKKKQLAFALDAAKRVVEYFEHKTGIPYPLEKLDLLLATDFRSGAMENWGLITFRDSRLLVDPELSTVEDKKSVMMVVAHEIAHMWFGDLVTMRWWNGTFLNESNANLMGYTFAADDQPQWNYMQDYLRESQSAFAVDGLKRGSHIIEQAVNTPAEIGAIFDSLTYAKGGSILRMLKLYMGDSTYWKGISEYLKAHAYGNAEPAAFWSSLEKATGGTVPVVKIAEDFFQQIGFPVVRAGLDAQGRLTLSQSRFFNGGDAPDKTLWTVPMIIRYGRGGKTYEKKVILDKASMTVDLGGSGPIDWLYTNGEQAGYFRAAFEGDLNKKMIAALPKLRPIERMGWLNDLWAQARAGGSMDDFLAAVRALRNDDNRFIIEEISGYLQTISDRLIKTPEQRKAYEAFVENQFAHHWRRLGWSKAGDTDEDKLSRAAVIGVLGPQRPEIVNEAKNKLAAYFNNPKSLDPVLLIPALEIAAGDKNGAPEMFEKLVRALAEARTPGQKDAYLRHGFIHFKDDDLVKKAAQLALTDKVQKQDAWILLTAILRSPVTQNAAWPFIKANFPAIKEKIGTRSAAPRIISAAGSLQYRGAAQEIHEFFSRPENDVDTAIYALPQAEEASLIGTKFAERMRPTIGRTLKKFSK